ncbi:MAG: hypothetical protein AAGH43_15085 [Pseudomonadota bacterium]
MNALPPGSGRATVRKDEDNLWIDIPAKRNWLVTAFLAFWLSGWTVGGVVAIGALLSGTTDALATVFMMFWLSMWAVGWVAAATTLLWLVFGWEHVWVRADGISVMRRVPFWKRTSVFAAEHVARIRVSRQNRRSAREYGMESLLSGKSAGTINFDYGRETRGFGLDLDEPEAAGLIGEIETFMSRRPTRGTT